MTTISDLFNYRTPVKSLYNDFTDAKPINYDWGEGWPDAWDYMAADECPECGNIIVGTGECRHEDSQIEDDEPIRETDCTGVVYLEGPMMNYYYPIDFKPVGGIAEAAIALRNLPLVPVTIGDNEAIALSGGGMDLSIEICIGYMKLGYLPPVHFSGIPHFAGAKLDAKMRWLIAGLDRSLEIEISQAAYNKKRIRKYRNSLKSGPNVV